MEKVRANRAILGTDYGSDRMSDIEGAEEGREITAPAAEGWGGFGEGRRRNGGAGLRERAAWKVKGKA